MKNKNLRGKINYKDNIIKKIRGFCFTMKYKSMTKAARFLYLTQPAVSFQIQSLEKDLKIKLFKKEKNRIIPTPDAYKFYNFAKDILYNFEHLYQNFLKLDSSGFCNEIKIAGNSDYLSQVATDILNKVNFSKDLKIKLIQIEHEMELIDLFIKDLVDIIGVNKENLSKLTLERKDFIKIRRDVKVYGILIKKKDFANKILDIKSELHNMNFIYNEKYEERIKYFIEENNLKKNIFLDTENMGILESLIENNYGYAFCSSFNIKKMSKFKNKKIKFVKMSKLIERELFFSICKKNSFISKFFT